MSVFKKGNMERTVWSYSGFRCGPRWTAFASNESAGPPGLVFGILKGGQSYTNLIYESLVTVLFASLPGDRLGHSAQAGESSGLSEHQVIATVSKLAKENTKRAAAPVGWSRAFP